jgi:hypothetical protein
MRWPFEPGICVSDGFFALEQRNSRKYIREEWLAVPKWTLIGLSALGR